MTGAVHLFRGFLSTDDLFLNERVYLTLVLGYLVALKSNTVQKDGFYISIFKNKLI